MTEERKKFEAWFEKYRESKWIHKKKPMPSYFMVSDKEAMFEGWQAARQFNHSEAVAKVHNVDLSEDTAHENKYCHWFYSSELLPIGAKLYTSSPQTADVLEKVIEIIKRNANKYDECYATVIVDEIRNLITQPESEGK